MVCGVFQSTSFTAPARFFVVNSREHPATKVGKTRVRFVKPHQIAKAIEGD